MLPITFMCNFPPLVTFYGWLSPKLFPKPSVFQRRGRFPAQSRITLISKASLCVPDVHVEHCAVSPRFLTVFFSSRSSLPFGREPGSGNRAAAFLAGCAESLPPAPLISGSRAYSARRRCDTGQASRFLVTVTRQATRGAGAPALYPH